MNKEDCFAFCKSKNKPICNALNELKCENCSFYKPRNQIKKNPFYGFSYEDEIEHIKDVKKRNIKEGIIWK